MNEFSTCLHFSLCSGCSVSRDFFNPPIRKDVERFFKSHEAPIAFETDGFSRTRYKAKLAIRGTAEDPLIGLFKKNSHEVTPIPSCLVHHLSINRGAALLSEAISETGIIPYREAPAGGMLRYAQFFVERSTDKVQLALVVQSMAPEVIALCERLAMHPLWHSIWINLQPKANNQIFGSEWRLFSGDPWLWQKMGAEQIAFHPAAFSQAHLPLFDRMIETVKEWTFKDARVVELFAGTGAIGLSLVESCARVDFVENNPFSALCFSETLKRLPHSSQKKCLYWAQDASLPSNDCDILVLDPPRKGIDSLLIEAIGKSKASGLIYISCRFASFRKDAERLIEKGWTLDQGKGFFLFPGTNEIEVCAYFSRDTACA